jgi:hypothetical protein
MPQNVWSIHFGEYLCEIEKKFQGQLIDEKKNRGRKPLNQLQNFERL